MRVASGVSAIVLILFAGVQYNDPDVVFWGPIYAGGALLCALAALRPRVFSAPPASLAYAAGLLASLAGTVWFWPATSQWWTRDVWWQDETAREGMGMMVLVLALLLALPVVWRHRGGGHRRDGRQGEKRLERI